MVRNAGDSTAATEFQSKLKASPSECFKQSKEMNADIVITRARAFEWDERFVEGGENAKHDQRQGRPVTTTEQNAAKNSETARTDVRLSIRTMADMVRTDNDELNTRKVCTNTGLIINSVRDRKMPGSITAQTSSNDLQQNLSCCER